MFLLNNWICKFWTQIGNTFLIFKDYKQKIMVLELFLFFEYFNFFFLPKNKKKGEKKGGNNYN